MSRDMVNENNRVKLRLGRAKVTGAWLTMVPELLNGTNLLVDEFRDNLRIRFGLIPLSLQLTCDGCKGKPSVDHAL